MTLDELRTLHPEFSYDSYSYRTEGGVLKAEFRYHLKPDIEFTHRLEIPVTVEIPENLLKNVIFHIGMVLSLSYWKAACAPLFQISAGNLTKEQITWWKELLTNGLGEFYFTNHINFSASSFVTLTADASKPLFQTIETSSSDRALVMAGGGKESVVTLELMDKNKSDVFQLNPTTASREIVAQAGHSSPLIATSLIDPKLLELNKKGYMNGHTPFSAFLAFLGSAVALLNGYTYVVASNEKSAEESSVEYLGRLVNHQYSKTLEFERLFRDYTKLYVSDSVEYFSFLRPLYDLQIARLFGRYPKQFQFFRSCNVGSKTNSWCLSCAKCAFVFISLFPFLTADQITGIFGTDLYRSDTLYSFFYQLTGLKEHKPFECVGTYKEARLAVLLAGQVYLKQGGVVPENLLKLTEEIEKKSETLDLLKKEILENWGESTAPSEFVTLLKSAYDRL